MAASLFGTATAEASGLPPVVPDVTVWTAINTPFSGNLLTGATDLENDTLKIYGYTDITSHYGTLTVNKTTGDFTYTPQTNWTGSTSVAFWVDDGLNRPSATLDLNVAAPPVAANQTVTATEDTPLEVSSATMLSGATDPGGFTLSISDVSNATGGQVALAAGTATFTPTADLCGAAEGSFDYTVTNEHGLGDTGHATVNITCVNDAPVCAGPVTSSGPIGIKEEGTVSCADVDSASLTYALVSQPAHGTAVVDTDGSWSYTPEAAYSGADSFTFKANDGSLDSAPATVSITVDADVTAPNVAMPGLTLGTSRIDESASIKISWSATDSETGVASYIVQEKVGTAGWRTIYTGAGTSITRSYRFSTPLVWRVMATDKAGNPSAWKTTTTHSLAAYQEGSSSVYRSGYWPYVASSYSSGTGYRYTTSYLRYAQLRFGGLQVAYVAPKVRSGGYVKVYVDGVYKGRYSTYRSVTLLGQVIAKYGWASSGTHTIKIVNAQSGHRTTLDAFVVLR